MVRCKAHNLETGNACVSSILTPVTLLARNSLVAAALIMLRSMVQIHLSVLITKKIMLEFYVIGMIIAFLLGCRLYYKEKDKIYSQIGMIAPLTIMSWISVVLIIWKFRDKL